MTPEFYWMVAKEKIYETRKYRYIAHWISFTTCHIYRAERKILDSKLALMGNPWVLVQTIYIKEGVELP